MNPEISIIIPTHNRPRMIRRAINSIEEQTFSNWEVIIVDDGSQPPLSVTLPEVRNHPRIRYEWQSSRGPGAARRRGASLATGALLCFLDDDDYYLPDHLRTVVMAYANCKDKFCLVAVGLLQESITGSRAKGCKYSSGNALVEYWREPHSLLPFAIPAKVIIDTPILAHYDVIEDFEWMCRLLSKYPLCQLPDYTVVYVEHETNRTNKLVNHRSLLHRERIICDLYAHPEINQQVSKRMYHHMLTHQRLHWTRQAIRGRQWKAVWLGLHRSVGRYAHYNTREWLYTAGVFLRTVLSSEK